MPTTSHNHPEFHEYIEPVLAQQARCSCGRLLSRDFANHYPHKAYGYKVRGAPGLRCIYFTCSGIFEAVKPCNEQSDLIDLVNNGKVVLPNHLVYYLSITSAIARI